MGAAGTKRTAAGGGTEEERLANGYMEYDISDLLKKSTVYAVLFRCK